jgi:quercetin dioxygenase-like cupin family protein
MNVARKLAHRKSNVTLSQSRPITLAPGAGPVFWILDLPGRAKATGEQTRGLFSMVEVHCPAGYATPLHIHYLEDEAVYVLAGHLTFSLGGRHVVAAAGGYVHMPRGIAHGFRVNGEVPARILCLTVPAGADHGRHARDAQASLLGTAALDLETLADLAARFSIDVLGPLPSAPAE